MNDGDTHDSLLAATPDGGSGEAAQILEAASREGLDATSFGAMLVALGGPVDDEDALAVLLQRVVEVAADVIDGADSAGVTIALGDRVFTAVHTDSRTLDVDEHQYTNRDGPCLEAARTRSIVRVDVLGSERRWPDFLAAARREGILSFLAAPLTTADTGLGALNLYGRSANSFDAIDEHLVDILTSTASRAIGDFARFKSAVDVADALRSSITHRAPIEQAKGMLMAVHGISADAAFDLLRKQSQTTNRKLRDIAAELIESLSSQPSP